jgi:hypothetical protein
MVIIICGDPKEFLVLRSRRTNIECLLLVYALGSLGFLVCACEVTHSTTELFELCIPSVQTDKGIGVKLNFVFAVLSLSFCLCVCARARFFFSLFVVKELLNLSDPLCSRRREMLAS